MTIKILTKSFCTIVVVLVISTSAFAQSLDIPASTWGISFGNSKTFSGIRFNFRDMHVDNITGLNVTLWSPKYNEQA